MKRIQEIFYSRMKSKFELQYVSLLTIKKKKTITRVQILKSMRMRTIRYRISKKIKAVSIRIKEVYFICISFDTARIVPIQRISLINPGASCPIFTFILNALHFMVQQCNEYYLHNSEPVFASSFNRDSTSVPNDRSLPFISVHCSLLTIPNTQSYTSFPISFLRR